MATFGEEEDDDFFGAADDDDDDCLAEQEANATATKLQAIAYLDAFDETNEVRLQEGFESGYREVFAIASRLGCRLGAISARAKYHNIMNKNNDNGEDSNVQVVARNASRRFRAVMDQINKGEETSEDAKTLLLELEEDVNRLESNKS